MLKYILIAAVVLLILILGYFFYLGIRSHTPPTDLGMRDDAFKPCPDSPNCVNTQASESDKEHFIRPILYSGTKEVAMERMLEIIQSTPRTEILKSEDNYLHVTFTSALFRFTDDVEFYFPSDKQEIHFRSASRVGYSDLGANRKRMEDIREKFGK